MFITLWPKVASVGQSTIHGSGYTTNAGNVSRLQVQSRSTLQLLASELSESSRDRLLSE